MLGVDLITEEIKESKNFQILSKVFSYHYVNKDNLKPIISYDEFKEVLTNFIEEIMNDYLIKSGNINEKGCCEIVNFNKRKAGDCIDTKIRLDEDVVKDIFLGNICELFNITHEITHVKYNVDTFNGKLNKDIIKHLKEYLIEDEVMNAGYYFQYDYYTDNYDFISTEKLANIEGINLLLKLFKMMKIKLTDEDIDKLYYFQLVEKLRYEINLRNFTGHKKIVDSYLSYEEAFDFLIKDHPEWLDHKQLQIEYYQDEEGKVKKRTSEELQSLLEREEDEETRKYIESLVKQNKDKKEEKFKQKKYDYVKFSKITNANNKKYCQE